MINGNDVMVLVRLAAKPQAWTFRSLGEALEMDPAALHRAVARLSAAKLLDDDRQVNRSNLEEFLIHAIRYVVPVDLGPEGRGIPTAWGAEPLCALVAVGDEPAPVWSDANGQSRGADGRASRGRRPEAFRGGRSARRVVRVDRWDQGRASPRATTCR